MNKSSALLVSSSLKQIYKTLQQIITSPIMPQTAILATSHKITILLSTTVGKKKGHQKGRRPVLCLAVKPSSPTGRAADYCYINASVQAQ